MSKKVFILAAVVVMLLVIGDVCDSSDNGPIYVTPIYITSVP